MNFERANCISLVLVTHLYHNNHKLKILQSFILVLYTHILECIFQQMATYSFSSALFTMPKIQTQHFCLYLVPFQQFYLLFTLAKFLVTQASFIMGHLLFSIFPH